MAAAVCDKIWRGLHKLRDTPPLNEHGLYEDENAYEAARNVSMTMEPMAHLPRSEFLDTVTLLVEGTRMDELVGLFKDSQDHPALQHATLLALHAVAELKDRGKEMLSREDVVLELLAVMASPSRRRISPMTRDLYTINSAAGAVTTITGLFFSNDHMEPAHLKIWVQLGAIPALVSALNAHEEFDPSVAVSAEIPSCFSMITTALLGSAAAAVPEATKKSLAEAWLTLFVDRRLWIANDAAECLGVMFNRSNWMMGVVNELSADLRKKAVSAARQCEREGGAWVSGSSDELARALSRNDAKLEEKLFGRECAGPGCALVQRSSKDDTVESATRFKRCSRCRANVYCSRKCQAAHWKAGHKKACVVIGTS